VNYYNLLGCLAFTNLFVSLKAMSQLDITDCWAACSYRAVQFCVLFLVHHMGLVSRWRRAFV